MKRIRHLKIAKRLKTDTWIMKNVEELYIKLSKLENIEKKHNMSIDEIDAYITEHKKIEQEFLGRKEKLEKALKIIKEKKVDIEILHYWHCRNYEEYKNCYKNSFLKSSTELLTETEFNLFKEMWRTNK